MKKSNILHPILAMMTAVLLTSTWSHAEQLAPEGHTFEVNLPGKPTYKEQSRSIGIGTVTSENYIVENPANTYFVSIITIPGFASAFTPNSVLFGQTRDGMLDDVKGTQITYEDFEVAGKEGKLLIYKMSPPDKPELQGKAQFFRMGKKMYLFATYGTAAGAPQREAFFKSIRLKD